MLRHPLATTVFSGDVVSGDYCTVDESAPEVVYECHKGKCKPFMYVDFPIDAIRRLLGLAPNLEMIKLRLTFNSSW